MGVPLNYQILIGFSSINQPFWGSPIYGNPHIYINEFSNWGSDSHQSVNKEVSLLPILVGIPFMMVE